MCVQKWRCHSSPRQTTLRARARKKREKRLIYTRHTRTPTLRARQAKRCPMLGSTRVCQAGVRRFLCGSRQGRGCPPTRRSERVASSASFYLHNGAWVRVLFRPCRERVMLHTQKCARHPNLWENVVHRYCGERSFYGTLTRDFRRGYRCGEEDPRRGIRHGHHCDGGAPL